MLLWALLGAVAWSAGTAVELALFRRLNWTFEAFCEALLAPAAQAAAIAALGRRKGVGAASVWRAIPAAARVLLVADAALAAFALLARRLAAGRPSAVVAVAIAAQAGGAGLLALRMAARRGWTPRERFTLAGAGSAALAAAASAFFAHRLGLALLPRAAALVRLLVLGLGGFAAAVALMLLAAKTLAARSSAAGKLLDAATAALLAAGTIAALQFFRFPRVLPPWDGVVRAVLLAAAGLALAAFLTAPGTGAGERA